MARHFLPPVGMAAWHALYKDDPTMMANGSSDTTVVGYGCGKTTNGLSDRCVETRPHAFAA